MKIQVLFSALLLGFCLSFSSCVSCETCTALDEMGEVTYEGEGCGKKSVRDQVRQNCENMVEAHGGECNCVKSKPGDED